MTSNLKALSEIRRPLLTARNILTGLDSSSVEKEVFTSGRIPSFLSLGLYKEQMVISCETIARLLNSDGLLVDPYVRYVVDFEQYIDVIDFFGPFINSVNIQILLKSGYTKSFSEHVVTKGYSPLWSNQVRDTFLVIRYFNFTIASLVLEDLVFYLTEVS